MLILLNLLSGVALLVWGSHIVRTGILRVLGADLRRVLGRSTDGRLKAFLAGIGVTSLVQSSNATAVIVMSFAAQGLLPLASGLAIMLGADVGTALMARVLTLDLSWLSPILVLFGVPVFLSRKQTRLGQVGRTAIGLGLILLALHLIVEAAQPMMSGAGVRVMFGALTGDTMLDALVGAAFAMISYSSLAAVLLTATLASSGVISLKVALCLVIGANLGSGMLALFGTLAQNAAARRLALGSLAFKFAGALLILPFAPLLARGLPVLIANPREATVGFHLIYNTLRCCACLLLIDPVGRICERLLPDRAVPNGEIRPLHLDAAALSTPSLALANAAREVLRVGDIVRAMLDNVAELLHHNDLQKARETIRMDDDIDHLYAAVKTYLAQISREQLDEPDSRRWTDIIALTINLEHAGDIIERIVSDIEEKKISHRLSFSEEGLGELEDLHTRLVSNLQLGLSVFLNNDLRCAERLLAEKERFRDLERAYSYAHVDRLAGQTLRSIETSALHLDLISDMKRLNSLFCSTAYPVLDAAGALRETRLRKRALDTMHVKE
ncbi:Na/Pi cotransporter family protein [Paraburkholderia megapolitana]|uniref:Phosphate:Na+ symporter n=1 Tax=Paraburkholderia megapolitana TaxID=420953 RepID=A0A1I3FX89_9BURK|nr:Na/Pi cotransporter family protein [Paraburkholderia megapolitana]QDQ82597.1 Na/Pi cotransporter family protein [Paraburkholderia megapolitana]SFI15843.1 phosphate:Na+ symporter [Paraburkholderia megapolitana]